MKKIFIAIILFIVNCEAKAQVDIGIKAGINHTTWFYNVQVSENLRDVYKIAFQGGIFAKYQFSKRFQMGGELLYSKKGEGKNTNLNYINAPIYIGYKIGMFNIEIGPQVGFLINAKYILGGNVYDETSKFRFFELASIAGLSFDVTEKLKLNLRYSVGITPAGTLRIFDYGISRDNVSVRNSTLQLSVEYRIK